MQCEHGISVRKYCSKCSEMAKTLCDTCGKRPGTERVDNGLKAGRHCDLCWNAMLSKCRSRSW